MSSCAPVALIADPALVEQAVAAVAEKSFFAFAEPGDRSVGLDPTTAGPLLRATVQFTGPVAGVMSVTLPAELTRELAELFSGESAVDLSSEQVADMAGEIANMITGSWLTSAMAAATFDLSAPVVEPIEAWVCGTAENALMQINGQPVVIDWRVE